MLVRIQQLALDAREFGYSKTARPSTKHLTGSADKMVRWGVRYKLLGPSSPEGGPGIDCVEYVFVFLDGIIVFRLYKLALSYQAPVAVQLRVTLFDLVKRFLAGLRLGGGLNPLLAALLTGTEVTSLQIDDNLTWHVKVLIMICVDYLSLSIHQNLKNIEDYSEDVFIVHTVFT
jgi:hypothetical protein